MRRKDRKVTDMVTIEEIISNCKACHLAMVDDGMPYVVPLNFGYYFSSIIGMGNVEFVEDIAEKCKALSLLMKHQADREVEFNEGQANSVCVYKVYTDDFSGKKKQMPAK